MLGVGKREVLGTLELAAGVLIEWRERSPEVVVDFISMERKPQESTKSYAVRQDLSSPCSDQTIQARIRPIDMVRSLRMADNNSVISNPRFIESLPRSMFIHFMPVIQQTIHLLIKHIFLCKIMN